MNLRLYFIQQNYLFTVGNAGLILSMKETKVQQRQYCTAGISVAGDQLFPYLFSGTSRAAAPQGHCLTTHHSGPGKPWGFCNAIINFFFFYKCIKKQKVSKTSIMT